MAFFCLLARSASLSATARELGITTPAASKRLSQMEARLGVQLVSRTTRRLGLTDEGQTYLAHARRILDDIAAMEQAVAGMPGQPQGLLRINATLGFGRSHIAPLIASFVRRHPQIQVQLQLSASPPPWSMTASTWRRHPRRLALTHNGPGRKTEAIRLRDSLSTNDGEIAVGWALAGLGIVMRAEWDVARYRAAAAWCSFIVESLTRAIVEHRLLPGTKLAEQKLADHFGVSRTLVRQALFQLSQNRLIRLEPARGAFVATPSVDEARQVFAVRRMLEAEMVRAFIAQSTPAKIRALRQHVAAEKKAMDGNDVGQRTELLGDFTCAWPSSWATRCWPSCWAS
ncbi:Protein mab-21-like 4 [Manis javanica]|nr:Protein mab-21-like 4 [Manis javanica]